MDVKQEKDQETFDLREEYIKTEKEIGPRKPQTVTVKIEHGDTSNSESRASEQFTCVDVIKEEIIKCEMPNLESVDLPTHIDHVTVCEKVQIFPETMKQEPNDASDFKMIEISDIKQEVSENIQPKTECELLTSLCDLQTTQIENTDYPDYYYLGPSSSKPLENTAKVTLKKKRKYACPICQTNFPSSKSRSTHIDGHFEKCNIVCQFCGKLMTKIGFFHHFYIHVVKHRTKIHFDCDNKLLKKKPKHLIGLTGIKPFSCDICYKVFTRKSYLSQHLSIHRGEKPFKCDICSKGFNRKSHLQQHLVIHSGKKPFKCIICSKEFTHKSGLSRHLKSHSSKNSDICFKEFTQKFKCNICSKNFNDNFNFRRHLRIHSDEKPFKCDICSKSFYDNSGLRRHMKFHSDEKPFKCDICSKCFIENSALRRHLKNHSDDEKPVKCYICSKGFNCESHLQRHLNIHTDEKPFKCDICSKSFRDKSTLQRHLKIHSDEKPFKCETCSKSFRDKSALQQHIIIHSVEKPFKCDICFKGYTRKSFLKKHLIIHGP